MGGHENVNPDVSEAILNKHGNTNGWEGGERLCESDAQSATINKCPLSLSPSPLSP